MPKTFSFKYIDHENYQDHSNYLINTTNSIVSVTDFEGMVNITIILILAKKLF